MRRIYLIACAGLVALAGAPANAQAIIASPESLAPVLLAKGFTVSADKDASGDPRLRLEKDGYKSHAYLFDCTDHRNCTSMQFYAGFSDAKVDAAKLNEWNRKHRYGRAYIDGDGDPVVEMDIDMDAGGMPRALFYDNVDVWLAVVQAFGAFAYGR